MRTVNMHAAKTHLSSLSKRCEGGEIIIAKAGKPVAKLVPIERRPTGAGLSGFSAARSGRRPMPGTLIRSLRGYSTKAIRAFRAALDDGETGSTLRRKPGG